MKISPPQKEVEQNLIVKFHTTVTLASIFYLEPQTTINKWLFQLDDSKSLYRKWLFHQTSIYKWVFGVPGTDKKTCRLSLLAWELPSRAGKIPSNLGVPGTFRLVWAVFAEPRILKIQHVEATKKKRIRSCLMGDWYGFV